MFYKYELVTKAAREEVDLLDYEEELKEIIKNHYEDNLIYVAVSENEYEYELKEEAKNSSLRILGRVIARRIKSLQKHIKTDLYTPRTGDNCPRTGKSNKLFIRVENK